MRRRRDGRATAALVTALLVGALVSLGAPSAQAHNGLRSTTPGDGEQVALPPREIALVFDQPALAVGTAIVVTGPDGAVVSQGEPQLVDATVSQVLTDDLAAGNYEVVWRVTSADGHPISGSFAFTATSAAAPTAPSATESKSTDSPSTELPSTGSPSAESPTQSPTESPSAVPVLLGVGAVAVALVVGGLVASRRRSPNGPPGQS